MVPLNNKLDWTGKTDLLLKKVQRSYSVCRPLLRQCSKRAGASVVSYAAVCWGRGLQCCGWDKKQNGLIKKEPDQSGTALGTP